jgi:holo-[acyl-carrier protein] synthase
MLRTGVDMIEVNRVARAINRHGDRFFYRFYTDRELAYCGGHIGALAARFAAKEAAAKALGTGIGDVQWVDIEIINGARGEPKLVFHGAAQVQAEKLGLEEWSVSLSHTREHAVALVIARGHERGVTTQR